MGSNSHERKDTKVYVTEFLQCRHFKRQKEALDSQVEFIYFDFKKLIWSRIGKGGRKLEAILNVE